MPRPDSPQPPRQPNISPEQQKGYYIVQGKLMARLLESSGMTNDAWVDRYAAAFKDLFYEDGAFAALVTPNASEADLEELQRQLDARTEH